jgi:hypothetical protein
VTADNYNTQEEFLAYTIGQHYERTAPAEVDIPRLFDAALRDIFPPLPEGQGTAKMAANLLRHHRRNLVRTIFYWTGLNYDLVRALVIHLESRCAALNLQVGPDPSAKLIEITTLITTLAMNRVHTGEFVQR